MSELLGWLLGSKRKFFATKGHISSLSATLIFVFLFSLSCGDSVLRAECGSHTGCDGLLACVDGVCVDLCRTVKCGVGEVCVYGACYMRSCSERTCPEGLICIDGDCVTMSCAEMECGEGELCADGRCFPTNCGGFDCGAGVCVNGLCTERSCVGVRCPAGETCAGGECYPIACETLCRASEVCVEGVCVEAVCVNVSCQNGFVCVGGVCVSAGGGGDCQGSLVSCGGQCVDTTTNPSHCGGCGRGCDVGQTCLGGQCVGCAAGLTLCSGICVDTTTNPSHCGACGNSCGAGQACSGGQCVGCAVGLTACGGACVDTMTDAANCGACGQVCTGGRVCSNGNCVCQAGLTWCNGQCVDTLTDKHNCGSCGRLCGIDETCSSGVCVCAPGACIPTCEITSPTDAQYVISFYIGYLQRAAEPAGLDWWAGSVSSGQLSLVDVAVNLSMTEEAARRYSFFTKDTHTDAEVNAFITSVYGTLFNAIPDSSGLSYWRGEYRSGNVTKGNMIAHIITSAYTNRNGSSRESWCALCNKMAIGDYLQRQAKNRTGCNDQLTPIDSTREAELINLISSVGCHTDMASYKSTVNAFLASVCP